MGEEREEAAMGSAPARSMYHERPDYRVDVLARTNVMTAWLGEICLARSNACLIVDEQDHGLVAYFPGMRSISRIWNRRAIARSARSKGRPFTGELRAARERALRGAIRSPFLKSPAWQVMSLSIRTRSA
jgi:hypothetical protein